VSEEEFIGRCIRCGRCVESCPYRCITMLDIRQGLHAGTPLIAVEQIPCYLCMKCVLVCPTGSLRRVSQEATRMGVAVINTFTCAAWAGVALCRTCYDVCPFKGKAITLQELLPKVLPEACTGCGICTHACPVTVDSGLKAINIEPSTVVSPS
jgi:ferredoxin-type protein NapG